MKWNEAQTNREALNTTCASFGESLHLKTTQEILDRAKQFKEFIGIPEEDEDDAVAASLVGLDELDTVQ